MGPSINWHYFYANFILIKPTKERKFTMPRVTELTDDFADLINRKIKHRERMKQHEQLLPADFSGQIFNKIRAEASIIKERLDWLEGQLQRVNAELKEARAEVIRSCSHAWIPGRTRGNILFGFEVTDPQPDPNKLQLSPKALKMRQEKVYPLMKHKMSIEREISRRQMELCELRRMAERASQGDVTLIYFLSDAWRSRLEIGNALLGKLPPPVRMSGSRIQVDPYGNPIPEDALDAEGKPDLEGHGWRGDHSDALPGRPQDRNATFEKPEQAR
jgi:hypothetical protein